MKQCPTCNRTYPDNQQFCIEDGTPLATVAETPSDQSANAPYSQGGAQPPNNAYNPMPPQNQAQWTAPQSQGAPPKKSKLPWIIAGVVLLLILGIGVIAIVVGIVLYKGSSSVANTNSNYNSSRNSNRNSSTGFNTGSSSNSNSSASNSSGTDTSDSSSMSDDDKHKLFQAAGITKDNDLILKVLRKIGLMKSDNTMSSDYSQFIKDHFSWALRNTTWIKEYNDPAKAREYVNEHIND